jgi:hypothetical protein
MFVWTRIGNLQPDPDLDSDSAKNLDLAVMRIRDVYPVSRILIFVHPGSRILDPGFQIQQPEQRKGEKLLVVFKFFAATNFTKLKIILVVNSSNKNI